MRIVVSGLWHLGCVTAACLAEHFEVIGHDPEAGTVAGLAAGTPPIYEPGLTPLIEAGLASGKLRFTFGPAVAASADVIWIAYDTPVDANDNPDVEFVFTRIAELLPYARAGALIIISSQMPVGFVARLETYARDVGADVAIAYVPENLRLGQALEVFRTPDRVVAGVRSETDKTRLFDLLRPFTTNVVWMSPESAEMTKHALNGFLATSVTFINEIAGICERVGADVKDVERGLKTDVRIGERAYLSAGGGFAGGTLARDVRALIAAATRGRDAAWTARRRHVDEQVCAAMGRADAYARTRRPRRHAHRDPRTHLQARHRYAAPLDVSRTRAAPAHARRRRARLRSRDHGAAARVERPSHAGRFGRRRAARSRCRRDWNAVADLRAATAPRISVRCTAGSSSTQRVFSNFSYAGFATSSIAGSDSPRKPPHPNDGL